LNQAKIKWKENSELVNWEKEVKMKTELKLLRKRKNEKSEQKNCRKKWNAKVRKRRKTVNVSEQSQKKSS